MEIFKKHWKKIVGVIAVAAILVFAFWYGGRTPDSKGFSIGSDASSTTQASDSSEQLADVENDQMLNTANDQFEAQNTSEEDLEKSSETDQQEHADPSEEESADPQSSKDTIQTGGQSETSGNSEYPSGLGNQSDGKNESEGASGNKSGTSSGNTQTGNKNGPTTQAPVSEPEVYTCTISIYCDTVLNNMDLLDPAKASVIPSSGCILSAKTVEFTPGESVFDVLQRVTRQYGIPLEYSYTAIYGSSYIEGINNLYEFDCGEASGWMYYVNGYFPGYGCSQYVLNDKDVIKWVYTCNLGADVGNPY